MDHLRRAAVALAIVAGLSVAVAACGDDDDAVTTDPAAPSAADVSGSDEHLANMASEAAAEARANQAASDRLQGQADAHAKAEAKSYGDEHRQPAPAYVYGGDAGVNTQEAGDRAIAEAAEQQAHLDGQAETYSGQ